MTNNRNKYLKKCLGLGFLLVFSVTPLFMQAETTNLPAGGGQQPEPTIALLEPSVLPSTSGAINTFPVYARLFFVSMLSLIVVAAVLMIVWGGIEYMLSETPLKMASGKERIWGAITGLLLALVSWLILYSINPDIVTWSNNTIINGTLGQPAGNQQSTP